MPSAALNTPPSSLEDPPGSLETILTSEAYPKSYAQRVSSNGELQAPLDEEWREAEGIPFSLLPGESLSQFGDISSKTRVFLTNFRLFLLSSSPDPRFHNLPLLNIDSVEMRDMFYLLIHCKDGRLVKVFSDNNASCMAWFKLLNSFAYGVEKRDLTFAFRFFVWCREEKRHFSLQLRSLDAYLLPKLAPCEQNLKRAPVLSEFRRLGLSDSYWRISEKNENFGLCDSYPRFAIVPKSVSDSEIAESAKYRCLNRFPSLVWRDPLTGAVLLRSSQPGVGLLGWWRCTEDELLLNEYAITAAKSSQVLNEKQNPDSAQLHEAKVKTLLILDARSYTAGWANRAKGGGFESPEYYQRCEVQFMGLANIHSIRNSFQQLRTLLWSEGSDPAVWLQALQGTQWLQNLSSLMSAALRVCEGMREGGRSVLVHCSDGWDRTTQIVSLAKIFLDPYYRTMTGFRELVEREWIGFGHKFADRCGVLNGSAPNERSPVFLQWLDGLHQLLLQFPSAFQFNMSYLVKLAQHCYSGLFGSFLCNSPKDAEKDLVGTKTFSVWTYLHPDNPQFRNVIYDPRSELLWPRTHVKDLLIWHDIYCPSLSGEKGPRDQGVPHASPSMERSLNKAHSCNSINSLVGGEPGVSGMARTGSDSHLPPLPHNGIDSLPVKQEECPSSAVESLIDDVVRRVSISEEDPGSLDLPDGLLSSPKKEGQNSTVKLPNGHSHPDDSPPTDNPLDPMPNHLRVSAKSPGAGLLMNGLSVDEMEEAKLAPTTLVDYNSLGPDDGPNSDMSTSTSDISDSSVRRWQLKQMKARNAMNREILDQNGSESSRSRAETLPAVIRPGMIDVRKEEKRSGRGRVADLIDRDGLTIFMDPLQDRARDMRDHYERKIEFLESKLQQLRTMRNVTRARNGSTCHVCSSSDQGNGEGLREPRSAESCGGGSDVSWEAVEEGMEQPTRWIPDHAVSHCMGCDTQFWTINRRHHCRACGKVFCSACSSFESPVPAEQLYEPVRVCNHCYTGLRTNPPDTQLSPESS